MNDGYVYFIRPQGMDGPVKIGFSKRPSDRLHSLSGASPLKLELAAVGAGCPSTEKMLHNRFADQRSHGEWFDCSDDIAELISVVVETGVIPAMNASTNAERMTTKAVQAVSCDDIASPYGDALVDKYSNACLKNSLSLVELARAAGVAASTFSRWRAGKKPQGRTLRKLDAAIAEIERGRFA